MTDRAQAFIVHLDVDYRLGDEVTGADRIMAAIASLRGVAKVEPLVADYQDHLARERVRRELLGKLRVLLHDDGKEGQAAWPRNV